MKNVVLIGMAVLLVVGSYFLKTKSDRVASLEGEVASRDASLSELQARLKELDSRVKTDESTLAAERASAGASRDKLSADLAAAQLALSTEIARLQGLKSQESSLLAARAGVADPSLAGHIQNDQTRLADLNRQIKELDSSSKSQSSAYKADEKTYRAQVKEQEKVLGSQIKGEKDQLKSLERQFKDLQKKKNVFDKPAQLDSLQKQIDDTRARLSGYENENAALKSKETSDISSNAYEEERKRNYVDDQRSELLRQREQVAGDLENLKSRSDLSKRDTSDISGKIKSLQAQEHDSDVKIQDLNQTVARLKGELAK